jgi:hypothetical protein
MNGLRQIAREQNDEIRMTNLEGMTNDQMPGDFDIAFRSFGLHAFFVIRHSRFIICGRLS